MSEAKSEEELLLLNSASIFLHFSYVDGNGDEKSWYDFSNSLQLITRMMIKKYVENVKENKERIVLNKSLWPTICSGDETNDIQIPKFDKENRYKTRVFTESEIEDLFYVDQYAKKGKKIDDSDYKLIVLPCGDNLKVEDLILFQEKRNESAIVSANEYKDALISSVLEDCSTFTSFDFIFAKEGGTKPDTYLIEISNITRSTLNRVNSRNANIAHQVYAERNKEKKENYSLSICKSFRNLLGDVQMNNATGKVKITASKKYESHILKVLPLIYKEDYYNDPYLLHSFVTNVESAARMGGGSLWYKILKYDLMFILSIQNNKQNKYMEIINSVSFKLGFKIGKMAKPLGKAIGSFEKNYVGLLSRRVSTKEDCIRFVTDLCQKLIMHDSIWSASCAEVCDDLANISESEYDKDELSFGFLDGYFKYEPTDKKKDFQKRLENKKECTNGHVQFTGPVQFASLNPSLNRVNLKIHQNTSHFTSKGDKAQGSIATTTLVPYSVVQIHGWINPTVAKNTDLKENDLQKMFKALWYGTGGEGSSFSRSKVGQDSLLLLIIDYKENFDKLYGVDRTIKLVPNESLKDEQIRSMDDYTLDFSKLKDLAKNDKIEKIRFYTEIDGIKNELNSEKFEEMSL